MEYWLKDVKIGDKLCYYSSHWNKVPTIITVEKITPTGQIVSEGKRWKNGRMVGANSWGGGCWLHQLTPDIIAKIERNKVLSYIDQFKFATLSTEELKQVTAVLKSRAAKNKEENE